MPKPNKPEVNSREGGRRYNLYRSLGGIHGREEFFRNLNNLMGILGMRGIGPASASHAPDFSGLLDGSEAFMTWVDYAGSIKEARIYIQSVFLPRE